MAGLTGWGLMKWFTGLFPEGIIWARGGEGGWVASFTSEFSYEIFLCLPFLYFSPYLESADSLFVLEFVGYLHCAIV